MRSGLGHSVTAASCACTSSTGGGILIFFLFFLSVIDSSHQASRSSYTEIRTSGALMDNLELMTVLAGSREHASLPARHGVVPAVNGDMGHIGPHTSSGDITPLGAGRLDSPSAGTATHLPAYSHHRGKFYWCQGSCLPCSAHGLSIASGLGNIPIPTARNSDF